MKILLSLLLLILFPSFSNAQKQGDIWYFGLQSGLDFSTGIPVPISNGQTGTDVPFWDVQEGTSSISNNLGNILFYTGGKTIWNRYHNPMPNGFGLMGGTSSTQSSIIIPQPGNDSLFYVFTSDEFQSYPTSKGYRYSIVNMCLDNGNGDVTPNQKNILLADSCTEKLSACEDIFGNGYWIMGHKMFSNKFIAWHLTSAGISNTVISQIGTVHGWESIGTYWQNGAAQGQMKFNSDGTRLAVAISNNDPAVLDLFDFNKATGIVSSSCHIVIDSALGKRIYGIEFSPNGSKLYASLSGGSGGKRIYQYDLSIGGSTCNSIISSRQTIFQSDFNSIMFGMQLATNQKIYVVCNSYNDLGCINFPDLTGSSSGFDSSAVNISGVLNNYTLPSFIAGYKYHNGKTCCDCDATNFLSEIIPNSFTPNDDGINDSWVISNIPPSAVLKIYDRWGLEVFAIDSNVNTQNIFKWEGKTMEGETCPDGVYYYIINTGINKYKGFIQLFR
jgi:gliding motility-associated-like protein